MSDEPKDFEWIPARICVIAHAYPDQHQALMVSRLQLAKMKIFVRPFPDVAVNPAMRQQYNSLGCATETWWEARPEDAAKVFTNGNPWILCEHEILTD